MVYTSVLSKKTCVPCQNNVPPMRGATIRLLLAKLGGHWEVVKDHHLRKEYAFPDFKMGLNFTIRVGEIAEREGHHPQILLSWGKVIIEIWTHKIDGLSESDFILAAKCDEAYEKGHA